MKSKYELIIYNLLISENMYLALRGIFKSSFILQVFSKLINSIQD